MISVPNEDIRLIMEAGYLYLGMYRFKEAQQVFEGVAPLVPKSEVPLVSLGNVYCVQAKFDQAITCYKKALKIQPKSAFAKSYLGEALFFKGDKEKALKALEEASKLDPKGKSGDFARSLTELIHSGFVPPDPKEVMKRASQQTQQK